MGEGIVELFRDAETGRQMKGRRGAGEKGGQKGNERKRNRSEKSNIYKQSRETKAKRVNERENVRGRQEEGEGGSER